MKDVIELEQCDDGVWRERVPGRQRPSGGVPRPPEHRVHAGGVLARALVDVLRLAQLAIRVERVIDEPELIVDALVARARRRSHG